MKELQQIQTELKAPKGQYNSFGKYAYRSCEDICEAVKPLLAKHGCTLTISDDIVLIGEFTYVKATATIKNSSGDSESTTAFARHSIDKKGMDDSQLTGATSSYARKYALNGLFCIDDTKDADATNDHGKGNEQQQGKGNSNYAPQGHYRQPQPQTPPANNAPANSNVITQKQRNLLFAKGKEKGFTNEEMSFIVFETVGVNSSAEIPASEFNTVLAAFDAAEHGKVM